MGTSCSSSLYSWCHSSSLYQELCCYRSWWFSVLSQPQTSLVLVTCVPFEVLNWVKSVFTSQTTAAQEAVPQSLPTFTGLAMHSQSCPSWWYLNIPPAGWVWEQPGTAPGQTLEYPTAGTHQRKRATVCALSHTKSLSFPWWGVWAAGQLSCWTVYFWLNLDTGISGLKPSQILWTDYYRREMLFLCHCFIRGCMCNY